ncbi:MAG: hypothetical protein J5779_01480, partial [Clostridia bacterium]|nr:hypothetical protein [Clostridia bacterium]
DIKKEESTKKRTQTRNDIVLGDHAKDGIVAAIKDGFKALKDMAKDSTNGIAGGLVSNVAKPFKLDKDSIKEKTEKAKMESKEAEHGKAETTRHSEMMKAINELKSILNSNNKGTVKLDKDSAKDIAKAISDSLKNKK